MIGFLRNNNNNNNVNNTTGWLTVCPPRYTVREEILSDGVLSTISVRRTERADTALFTCVATNAFGSDDTTISLIIQEVFFQFFVCLCFMSRFILLVSQAILDCNFRMFIVSFFLCSALFFFHILSQKVKISDSKYFTAKYQHQLCSPVVLVHQIFVQFMKYWPNSLKICPIY